MNDIMVDLETTATTADAGIISIGAVKFDLTSDKISDQGFYSSVSLQSNLDYGRYISEDTMRWWMHDDQKDARSVWLESKQGIDDALTNFIEWVTDGEKDPIKQAIVMKDRRIWCNGANFDEPILSHAITHCRLNIPWKFWNVRCVRTFKTLPGAKDIKVERTGVHHNALADALTQAALVQKIHATLFPLRMKRKERETA